MNVGNIERYRMFLATVELGSMSAAAERLGYSQPRVSQAMLALETEFNVRLFIRGKQGVRLTEEGQRLLEPIRALVSASQQLAETVDEMNGQAVGTVRIGTVYSVSTVWLPELLHDFQQLYPRILCQLTDSTYGDIAAGVENGRLDVGFYSGTVPEGLRFLPLVKDQMLAVLPPGHPLTAKEAVTAEQLAGEPFILYESCRGTNAGRTLEQMGIEPEVKHVINSEQAIMALISHGQGVSIMSGLSLCCSGSDVVSRPLDPPRWHQLGLLAPENRYTSAPARRFIEFTVRRLQEK